jgi:hypothetical protein
MASGNLVNISPVLVYCVNKNLATLVDKYVAECVSKDERGVLFFISISRVLSFQRNDTAACVSRRMDKSMHTKRHSAVKR